MFAKLVTYNSPNYTSTLGSSLDITYLCGLATHILYEVKAIYNGFFQLAQSACGII